MHRILPILEIVLVAAIVWLAGWMRFNDLGTNPPGVFRDETEKALNAWSLAQTGHVFEFVPGPMGQPLVQWRKHPLFLNVYGVETSTIYHWALSTIARREHPPTPFEMRIPAAAAGTLSVALLWLMLRWLYGPAVALTAALFLSISPWSVPLSRWALQGSFIPLFMIVGIGGLLLGRKRHPAWLLMGAMGMGLAFYTYSGARPFVLAFTLTAAALHAWMLRRHWRLPETRRQLWWALAAMILFLILIMPALSAMMAPGGTTRLQRIGVFGNGRTIVESLAIVLRNYLLHYSPRFLILHGDPQLRHGVAPFGVLHYVEFAFALLGLLFIRHRQERWLLLAWLVLFPVGAMLTNPAEMPHALRSIVALPLPQLLAAMGIVGTFERMRSWLAGRRHATLMLTAAMAATAAITAASAWSFANELFRRYPAYTAREWECGFGDALAKARSEAAGKPVAISGSIALAPYLVLYYDRTPLDDLQKNGWSALNLILLPPSNFQFQQLWPLLPTDTTLLAVPEDDLSGLAYPMHIIHPPANTRADAEQLPPVYVVYKKVK